MQKKLIIFIIILFVAASAWLFHASQKAIDPNTGKNWWVLEFENPTDSSLNFVIENHSNQTDFHWKLTDETNILREDDIHLGKGEMKEIEVGNQDIKKAVIQVTAGDKKKEIYKNF